MAYGRFYKRKTRMVAVKPNSARKYSTPRKKYSKTTKTTFAKKVNEIIARNVENKMTTSFTTTAPVCTLTNSSPATYTWFLQSNWNVKLFTLSQGAAQQQRIGNQIRLKKWIIRGLIHPSPNVLETHLANTTQGYVTIYFGRLLSNEELVNSLTDLYENGNSSQTPAGTMAQIFKTINKDKYKVYYKKTFKVAPSAIQAGNTGQPALLLANNDFSLVKTFGFDVCKYICKNAVIKYNDSNNDPNNSIIRQLGIWATWQPAFGDIGVVSTNNNSYYDITIQSYAEYEDA